MKDLRRKSRICSRRTRSERDIRDVRRFLLLRPVAGDGNMIQPGKTREKIL